MVCGPGRPCALYVMWLVRTTFLTTPELLFRGFSRHLNSRQILFSCSTSSTHVCKTQANLSHFIQKSAIRESALTCSRLKKNSSNLLRRADIVSAGVWLSSGKIPPACTQSVRTLCPACMHCPRFDMYIRQLMIMKVRSSHVAPPRWRPVGRLR